LIKKASIIVSLYNNLIKEEASYEIVHVLNGKDDDFSRNSSTKTNELTYFEDSTNKVSKKSQPNLDSETDAVIDKHQNEKFLEKMLFIYKDYNLYLFSPQHSNICEIPIKIFDYPDFTGICKNGNTIYFAGGLDLGGKRYIKSAKSIRINPDFSVKLQYLQEMIYEKSCNTLVCINTNWLFSLGGYNENGYISICEKYDTQKNSWQLIKQLNQPKSFVSSFSYMQRYIYCIGGVRSKPENYVEKYDIIDPENEWQLINFNTNNALLLSCMYYKPNIQINDSEFIIFTLGAQLKISLSTNSCTFMQEIPKDITQNQSTAISFNKKICYIEYKTLKINAYKINF